MDNLEIATLTVNKIFDSEHLRLEEETGSITTQWTKNKMKIAAINVGRQAEETKIPCQVTESSSGPIDNPLDKCDFRPQNLRHHVKKCNKPLTI